MLDVKNCSDKEIISNLDRLVLDEHQAMLGVLVSLSELDRRKLYLDEGFASMFAYCTEKLRYSEPAAMRRITAARTIRAFPEVYRLLRARKLTMCAIAIFASALTEENQTELLELVAGKSRREVEKVVAGFSAPRKKDVPDRIIPIRVQKTAKAIAHSPANVSSGQALFGFEGCASPKEERLKVSFSVSAKVGEKLEYAKRLLSSKYPEGVGLEAMLDEALECLIDSRCPKRRNMRRIVRKAKQKKSAKPTKDIPSAIRDAVYARDGHQCCFRGVEGKRCTSTWDLEIDHIVPRALGGSNEVENLRVLCRAHNLHEACRTLGKEVIERHVSSTV